MNDATLLRAEALQIGYKGRPLAAPLSFDLPAGGVFGVVGPNGSGKSTFVRTILGLQPAVAGRHRWADGTRFGYVPQEARMSTLFPLTVNDLLKMGLSSALSRWRPSSAAFERARDGVLELCRIKGLEGRLVRELSGGQRQRALIARALIGDPGVLVMDEPFNSLDQDFKRRLWDFIASASTSRRLTVLLIDHDLGRIAEHVESVFLFGGPSVGFGPTRELLKGTP